jgi:pilus assembly protein CpaB
VARSITATRTSSTRNRGILMLAVVFGLLSAVLVFAFLNSKSGNDAADLFEGGGVAETVVVASRDINPGDRITGDMVTVKTLPGIALQVGRFADANLVVGKVATTHILSGEQVVAPKITTFDGQNSLSFKVPDGLRALALTVPHESWIVGGLVQPGDRVDVVGITMLTGVDPLTGQERLSLVTGVIAENIEVLAVSQVLVKTVPNLDRRSQAGEGDPAAAPATTTVSSGGSLTEAKSYEESISVTLAFTVEEASKIALIDAMKDDVGQWRLIVRQKGDGAGVAGRRVWTLEDVFPPR